MKLSSIVILFVVLAVIGAVCIPIIFNRPKELKDDAFYDNMERKNDSLLLLNSKLDDSLKVLEAKVDSVLLEYGNQKTKVVYIKQKSDEAIKHIATLNNNQLFDLFSNITTTDSIHQ